METNGNEYKIESTKGGLKKIMILIGSLLVIVVIVGLVYYFTKINQAVSSESREVPVVIEKGTTTREITNDLAQKKIINSSWVFLLYTKLSGAGNKIEAGQYILNQNMPITEIVDVLTHGRVVSNERNVTTIEGWTNLQIAAYLYDRQIITKDSEFADTLQKAQFDFKYADDAKSFNYQGFLFPDTYKISKDQGAKDLAQKMLTNFESKITDKMFQDAQASGRQLKDVIILASIIEKEVGRNTDVLTAADQAAMQNERELVASVFYNRLKVGMPLESDATVNYITGKSDRSVTIADTKTKSPYNTYQVKGLPPGPISNPGIGAIMAAIYPATSDYVYFLNKPDGEAVFAKTLAEHNANKAKYLK